MSTIQLGRLTLGQPSAAASELMGDPIANTGGAIVPAERAPLTISLQLNTILNGASTLAQAQTLHRQIRAALSNSQLKLQGFLYFIYEDDTEQNAWLVPDPANVQSRDATAFKAVGLWETQSSNWSIAGRMRTHKEARQIWMKDLRTGNYERDVMELIISTDFSLLPALQLSVLPNGATSAADNVVGGVTQTTPLPVGRDGGQCLLALGLNDLESVTYERPESALNLSDVIAYDRRGNLGPFGSGVYDTVAGIASPQSAYGWEETEGVDYPWSWLNGGTQDGPVLENGLVRVRYVAGIIPGFCVDVWNGGTYVEQGKMLVYRNTAPLPGYDETWIAASMTEYTPERGVARVTLANQADGTSREDVYITVQRGRQGVTFECYPALASSGSPADAMLEWTPALNSGVADVNNSVVISSIQQATIPPPQGDVLDIASAGTGAGTGNSGLYLGGGATFDAGENWISFLRCQTAFATLGPWQTNLVVVQEAAQLLATSDSYAYGTGQDVYQIFTTDSSGYLQVQVSFAAAQAQQVMEAEAMTLGSGTSTSADANASGTGNNTTSSTRTSSAVHVSQTQWPNNFIGQFRLFARVLVTSGTASFLATIGSVNGPTATTTSTSYVWVDLGELNSTNSTLSLYAWISTGSGTLYVDRLEAFLTEDRTQTDPLYLGGRDVGQAALMDARQLGAVVAR